MKKLFRAGKKRHQLEPPGCYHVMAHIPDEFGKSRERRVGRTYISKMAAQKLCSKMPKAYVLDYNTKRPVFCVGYPRGMASIVNCG